jgi:hypothetical protein
MNTLISFTILTILFDREFSVPSDMIWLVTNGTKRFTTSISLIIVWQSASVVSSSRYNRLTLSRTRLGIGGSKGKRILSFGRCLLNGRSSRRWCKDSIIFSSRIVPRTSLSSNLPKEWHAYLYYHRYQGKFYYMHLGLTHECSSYTRRVEAEYSKDTLLDSWGNQIN